MKKVFAVAVAVALMLSLIPATVAMAQVGDIASIEKTFDSESAGLCDHVTGSIVIETLAASVVVTDEMPEGLALVNVTVATTGGGGYELDWDENSIEVTLNAVDVYTVSFEVQVTDVLSYDSIVVTNEATATDDAGNVDSASDDLELLPYTYYFDKTFEGAWLEDGTNVLQNEVPLGTKVYFLMYVDGYNSLSVDMVDAYVKDNLGGDITLDEWYTSTGTAGVSKTTGKTEKQHLLWTIGTVASGGSFISDLYVSTDINTGDGNGKKASGHQEYTEAGPHDLNSGATLKFNAGDTGFLCSVSSAAVSITVVE
jgi:hypothetical protein